MTTNQIAKMIATFAVAVSLAVAAPSAFAQTPTTATPAPQHQSIFHKLFGKKHPGSTVQPGTTPPIATTRLPYGSTQTHQSPLSTGTMSQGGSIIGNKNTHVYHLPGDHGTLPAMKNRVYFTSVSQAVAAGFHPAGGSHSSTGPRMTGHTKHATSTMAH